MSLMLAAAAAVAQTTEPTPVGKAREGFTPAQAADLLKRFNNEEALKGGDVSLFGYSNFSEAQRTAVIARNGPVVMLERTLDPKGILNPGKVLDVEPLVATV